MIRKDMVIMNLGKLMSFKKSIVLICLLFIALSAYAVNFTASLQRFLNEEKQTVFQINYKVLNSQINFVKTKQGYIANLDVTINLLLNGKIAANDNFPYNIGANTEGIAKSDAHYTLDKISMTLTRDDLQAQLIIKDKNTNQSNEVVFDLITLKTDALMSDIEICQSVKEDKTKNLELFHRGDYLYYVDPVPVFSNNQDSLYFYYELYNLAENANISEKIEITSNDSIVYQTNNAFTYASSAQMPYRTIPLQGLDEGFYKMAITVSDNDVENTKFATFSVKKAHHNITRIFDDDEEEFLLIGYFLSTKEKKQWKKLNENGKKNFIDRFWKTRNPNPQSEENAFLQEIKKRVDHANWKYSHFDKGWTSDMGRIYIKYGEPNEENSYTTDLSAKYSKKDYKVWKYNQGSRIYMFMDMFNSGRNTLIYSKNDYSEKTDPNWRSFFEKNWDASIIDETSDSTSSQENDSGWGW